MNTSNTRRIIISSGMVLMAGILFSSCASDPRTGGIFWSKAGAEKRLASMRDDLASKEALLYSYKSDLKKLQSDQGKRASRIAKLSSQIDPNTLASLKSDMSSKSKANLDAIAPQVKQSTSRLSSAQQQAACDQLIQELTNTEEGKEKITNKEMAIRELLHELGEDETKYATASN